MSQSSVRARPEKASDAYERFCATVGARHINVIAKVVLAENVLNR